MVKTVLVADDSPTVRKIAELAFSGSDCRVETAASGAEALDKIERSAPDVVVADIVMPAPSGYEVCRVVKGSERPVPVILLAGSFEPFDRALADECGADAHLTKPFEPKALLAKVLELLEPPIVETAEPEPPGSVEEPETDDADEDRSSAEPAAGETAGAADEDASAAVGADVPIPSREDVSPALVDAVAREVVRRLSREVVREVAWELVPKLATEIIRERIRELEQDEDD